MFFEDFTFDLTFFVHFTIDYFGLLSADLFILFQSTDFFRKDVNLYFLINFGIVSYNPFVFEFF